MEAAQQRFQEILNDCKAKQIDVGKLKCLEKFMGNMKRKQTQNRRNLIKFLLFGAIFLYCLQFYNKELQSKRCLLEIPRSLSYAFRPPEKCDFCKNVNGVVRLSRTTSEEFTEKYAYSGVPVVVEDATLNWTALTANFNYYYLRDVYQNSKRKQKILDCQFLPYKTGFKDIFQALDMPTERLNQEPDTKPWYFGWSNCNPETAEELRRHYGRPYFLPTTSENNAVDWFFIGTAGLGAHMHIDNVRLPSWQAQLKGSKRWALAPPPECYFECQRFDVVVKTGDIIVLDTNKWYHQTFVQPGEISLTIGAEYD